MSDEARKERQAKNEALFRALNERVRTLTDSLSFEGVVDGEQPEDYLCECADESCTGRVSLTREEYESVRASPFQFVVLPGHVVVDIETVVQSSERFMVVEKDPGEREHALKTHPRS
jgi:hypothetical protein